MRVCQYRFDDSADGNIPHNPLLIPPSDCRIRAGTACPHITGRFAHGDGIPHRSVPVPAVFYDINRFGLFFQGYVPPFNRFLLGQKRSIRRASTAYRKLRQYAAVYTNAESQATLKFRNNRFIVGLLQISYGILLTAEVKKYRCLCVCAKTAFAISTPVSFLYSFSFFHLVA